MHVTILQGGHKSDITNDFATSFEVKNIQILYHYCRCQYTVRHVFKTLFDEAPVTV